MSQPTPYKCILIGDRGVGKLHIIYRIVQNTFGPEYKTKIERAFFSKELNVNDKSIQLQIWGTCGAERYGGMSAMFYKGAAGAFLVYDITKRDSFHSLAMWLGEMRERCDPHVKIILLGNKFDEENERVVSFEEGENFAKENGLVFFEVSAKTAYNVTEAVTKMAGLMLDPSEHVSACCEKPQKSAIKLEEDQKNNNINWLVKKFFYMKDVLCHKRIFFCSKRKIKEGPKSL